MSSDPRRRPQPPGHGPPGSRPGARRGSIVPGAGTPPILDQVFGRDSLYALRAAVAAHALEAGLQQDRVGDLVVCVHELAANAVLHGAGHGRLQVWKHHEALHCLVTDDGAPPTQGTASQARDASLWRTDSGHGLWLVRQLANQISLHSGPHGTTATVSFTLTTRQQDPLLRLSQHSERGCAVVAITGQLDLHTADQLIEVIDAACAATPATPLVLDLAGLSSTDSAAVAALLTARQHASSHQPAQMIMASLPEPLLQRLNDSGLARQLPIAHTVDDAIRQLITPSGS